MVVARFRRVAVTLALSALGASLAGCTSSGGKPSPSAPPTQRPSSSASRVPAQHPLPDPSQIANSVKLRRQVQITSCVSTAGGWKAAGSAVNPAKKRLHLTITVFFTTTAATVLDYARTKVTVPPGATRTWTAAARFRPEPTMRCVLRGVG
jgi:hypothetical protein